MIDHEQRRRAFIREEWTTVKFSATPTARVDWRTWTIAALIWALLGLMLCGWQWGGGHGHGRGGYVVDRHTYETFGTIWPRPSVLCSRPIDPNDPAAWRHPWFVLPGYEGYHCIVIH
jgi:hypothetical protein